MQSQREAARELFKFIRNMKVFSELKEMAREYPEVKAMRTEQEQNHIAECIANDLILETLVSYHLYDRAFKSQEPGCLDCMLKSKLVTFSHLLALKLADMLEEGPELPICGKGILEVAQRLKETKGEEEGPSSNSDPTLH